MLPVAAGGAAAWLAPAKAQWLASTTLPKYRELLRQARARRSSEEESGSLFQQARERVLLRLRERRRGAAPRVDPRRAFSRLQERLAETRLSLRALKEQQKQRLQAYYRSAVAGGVATTASSSSSSSAGAAAAEAAQQPLAALRSTAAGEGLSAAEAERALAALGTDGFLRHLVLAGVGGACKLFLAAGARTSVEGGERMAAALARAPGRGLVTVSNHVGSVDDPLITSSIVPAERLLSPGGVRWTLCATDRCFKSALLAPFFRAAKVLPVERGAGLDQFGMRLARQRLAAGEWVHIFPEGTRSRDGRMLPVRKGVGWLVASAAAQSGGPPPLVLPFVHSGMERVLPKGAALPKLGQELRVLVGEPVEVADLLEAAQQQGWGEAALQVAIADRVGQALYKLKAELDGLPLEAVAPQDPRAAALSISDDRLLPLIEEEMDSLAHRWHDRWQRLSLPSLTQRVRAGVAARRAALASGLGGGGGEPGLLDTLLAGRAGASFEAIAAATEEGAGVISAWEHGAAAAAADDAPPPAEAAAAPLARLKLRLLRGGEALAAAVPAAASTSGPGIVAASPLDSVSALAVGSASSSGTLSAVLQAAAAYSAERAQHMRRLLGTPSDAAATPPLSHA